MIESPERYLKSFAEAGATFITVHAEACHNLIGTVRQIHELGVNAGVALNPESDLVEIADVIEQLDLLVIMSVNPGFGGQAYIPASTEKVAHDSHLKFSILKCLQGSLSRPQTQFRTLLFNKGLRDPDMIRG